MMKSITLEPTASFSSQQQNFMRQAIELAKKGLYTTSPNPRVGCVIVSQGKVVGQGYHAKAGQEHAEVHALAEAGKLAKGATAYVTLEPCSHFGRTPPCAEALIKAGVSEVIIAMVDPNPQVAGRGIDLLNAAGIKTRVGLLATQAQVLNKGFIQLMTGKKPYVRLKMAASLDGKTAMASGESKWITGKPARQDVQALRAQSCAIIFGADSAIIDNAKMTVRWHELAAEIKTQYKQENLRQPLRVVIDSEYRLTPSLALFQQHSPVMIVRLKKQTTLEQQTIWPNFVEQVYLPSKVNTKGIHKVDLPALLALLAERGLNDILIESGANLAGAFVEQNLVDELILYQAPKLLGGEGKNLLTMPTINTLAEAKTLTLSDITTIGDDVRITAIFNKSPH
jgi:diaminohydroxyphosphoribosylaminopyrimidine deaminase/5-amino-6-(5-phosphoribosylamino)uracil reductase